ncbi:transcriptional regulator [Pseudoruegeria sp. SK021]|nr:transcriptional regulator [Pseudoruegeria sp. SK021]
MVNHNLDGAVEKVIANSEFTLHENLVAGLRQLVIDGVLASGQRIPEAELCQRFGVSRTPLREALKVLGAQGLMQLRPNRGAIVTPLDPGDILPIFEVKGALERLIGLSAAERANDMDIDAMSALHLELGAALQKGDIRQYTELNYAFHKRLSQIPRNAHLRQSYDDLQQRIWRYRFLVNESFSRVADSFAEHEQIMIALRARTPLDLAARLESHNARTCEAMTDAARGAAQDPRFGAIA